MARLVAILIAILMVTIIVYFTYRNIRCFFRYHMRRNVLSQLVLSKEHSSDECKYIWDSIIETYRFSKHKDIRGIISKSELPEDIKELEISRFNRYFAGFKMDTALVKKSKRPKGDKVRGEENIDNLLLKTIEDNNIEVEYIEQ